MELRQINTFLTLAALNSFTQTAEKLGYTQPSITSQIQLLEQELGVKLFERLRKNVYLTAEGEAFLTYAKEIQRLSEESKRAMTTSKKILRIGTLESLAASKLSDLFKIFKETYPEVDLVVKIGAAHDFNTQLQENKIDVAFYLEAQIQNSDLFVSTAVPEPMAILAAPDHPIHQLTNFSIKDLSRFPLILSEEGCSYRKLILETLGQWQLQPCSIMEVGSTQAIRQLAISGLGVTILPKIAVLTDLENKSLIEKYPTDGVLSLWTQVVYAKDKWISPMLASFLEIAHSQLAGE